MMQGETLGRARSNPRSGAPHRPTGLLPPLGLRHLRAQRWGARGDLEL